MVYKPILSEDPKALKGALEWANSELARIEKEKEDAKSHDHQQSWWS